MHSRLRRYTRGIVAAGSFGALLLVALPLVDEYFQHRSAEAAVRQMRDAAADLRRAADVADQQREQVVSELDQLRRRATTHRNVAQARDALVDMARQSGCQIRAIDAAEPESRKWLGQEDSPLASPHGARKQPSTLDLQTTRISLTVVGTLEAIQELNRRIAQRTYLSVTDSMAIQPVDAMGENVQMELRIRLFGLEHRAQGG